MRLWLIEWPLPLQGITSVTILGACLGQTARQGNEMHQDSKLFVKGG
jgi:hypothetical protein